MGFGCATATFPWARSGVGTWSELCWLARLIQTPPRSVCLSKILKVIPSSVHRPAQITPHMPPPMMATSVSSTGIAGAMPGMMLASWMASQDRVVLKSYLDAHDASDHPLSVPKLNRQRFQKERQATLPHIAATVTTVAFKKTFANPKAM